MAQDESNSERKPKKNWVLETTYGLFVVGFVYALGYGDEHFGHEGVAIVGICIVLAFTLFAVVSAFFTLRRDKMNRPPQAEGDSTN